ncbi:MAG: DegQ family serine endoprotease [Pseudomonadota bacterium]|nr:DegQ family serine endoprotease [Pseudomonadota bacterium]
MKRLATFPGAAWLAALMLLLLQAAAARAADLPDFRQLVKDNSDAVVNITVTQTAAQGPRRGAPPLPEFPEGTPFDEFFKRFFEDRPGLAPERPFQQRGQGSGFVISPDGYILTNAHVVKDADTIMVRLHNRQEKTAKVIGVDERTDVALLKIDARDLPTVRIGDSDGLEVGEWVLAIGSPFGLEYTATQGIVSAVSRNLPYDAYVPFIQTDVAVNPGNSGGPLFNTAGEVVGINSQIYSRSGGYMGLSFAIPINTAMQVADQLKAHGQVTRGWLGVVIQNLDAELAQSFGLDRARGALVSQVLADSPAARAGVQTGDVIIDFNGKPVSQSGQLPYLVGSTAPGTQVPVTVLREGRERQLTVTVERLTNQDKLAAAGGPGGQPQSHAEAELNIIVADLSAEQRQEMNLERGVLVEDVQDGPAAEAGIQPGDVILSLDRKDVRDAAQLTQLVKNLPKGKSVPVLVQRGDSSLFLALKVPA